MTNMNPENYLTLPEFEAKQRTVYEAAPVTRDAIRALLAAVHKLVERGELITDALAQAGDNDDHGARFLCRYDIRRACEERIGRAALRLQKAKQPDDPVDVVAEALRVVS